MAYPGLNSHMKSFLEIMKGFTFKKIKQIPRDFKDYPCMGRDMNCILKSASKTTPPGSIIYRKNIPKLASKWKG